MDEHQGAAHPDQNFSVKLDCSKCPVMSLSLNELERVVAVQASQLNRFISDLESEKGTRARVNTEMMDRFDRFDERQRRSEKFQSLMIGGLGVIQFATMTFIALKK